MIYMFKKNLAYAKQTQHDFLVETRQNREALAVGEEDGRWDDARLDRFAVPSLHVLARRQVSRQLDDDSETLVSVAQDSQVVPPAVAKHYCESADARCSAILTLTIATCLLSLSSRQNLLLLHQVCRCRCRRFHQWVQLRALESNTNVRSSKTQT